MQVATTSRKEGSGRQTKLLGRDVADPYRNQFPGSPLMIDWRHFLCGSSSHCRQVIPPDHGYR
jgi:hypothetical protein